MKRSGFKRKVYKPMKRCSLKAKKGFKPASFKSFSNSFKTKNPYSKMKGFKINTKALRVVGHSETAEIKQEIQDTLRAIAILLYGGCVLRDYPEAGSCGGRRKDGSLILQAEHLESRSKSISFADMRNIVCLCKHHHGYWKPQNSKLYWELIEQIIGPERWAWLKRIQQDRRVYKMDWKLELLALQNQLEKLQKEVEISDSVINY